LTSEKCPGKHLHVRAIVRDGNRAFVGSQSLRKLELEKRREIGIIIDNRAVVHGIQQVFERDWALTPTGKKTIEDRERKTASEPKEAEVTA
jgi:phosphatidylserine/phosphatidylglycerophosphate/cardiolipin synthase-like enzyme